MLYASTRGGAPAVTFTDALLAGAPADGGAYVPTKVPTMDISRVLDRASFEDVCVEVLSPFVDSVFDREDVRGIAREVVSRYEGKEVCNVRRLGRRGGREARVAELFRGPTSSAEDASMRMTMRMLDRVLARKNKRANVVCCSTGEAGGGAGERGGGDDAGGRVDRVPRGRRRRERAAGARDDVSRRG